MAIVGGGLAGLAAAVGLSGRGWQIELFEARRQLGGRAGSFHDPASSQWVDHCQHVGMACCTNLVDFCRRTDLAAGFRRDRVLHFFGPDGEGYRFSATPCLPAPLHLGPSLLRFGFLSLRDRIAIARALWRLARMKIDDDDGAPTVGDWLRAQRQSAEAIERFWSVVLVSALGEELDRASLAHGRKVFVDGFLASRGAYQVDIPQLPLSELYGGPLQAWLAANDVALHLATPVRRIEGDATRLSAVVLDEARLTVDAVVVALPWRRAGEVFDESLAAKLPELMTVDQIESAPITAVHLWFDREITPLPHAVLVGRLSQWLFNRGRRASDQSLPTGHYYQVVISASRGLANRPRPEIIDQIVGELAAIWPAAGDARLLHARMVSEQAAVFSVRPGIERLRPSQQTAIANLALAGDWTRTGWPSTMEGAVRSGYLAAETILRYAGQPQRLLAADLPRGWLARWLIR
ncbi:MAG TPA: hydroxysqualene dehydroxylase HpnE [Pirellulales bacterium]